MDIEMTADPYSEHSSPFTKIRRTNEAGAEFWFSRDLAQALGYDSYRSFEAVIEKAKRACLNSGRRIEDHFVGVTEMIDIGKDGQRTVTTILMSRYACYLAIQNADPRKEIVARGQNHFAIHALQQELWRGQPLPALSADEHSEADEHGEDEHGEQEEHNKEKRRIQLQDKLRHHRVIQLIDAAKSGGVIRAVDYAIFQDHGYMGLYDGVE